MATFECQESGIPAQVNGMTTAVAPRPTNAVPVPDGERAFLLNCKNEIDTYYKAVKLFHEQEPDEVLRQVSAFTARLLEIRSRLMRSGGVQSTQFRTRELDPLMENLDLQWKLHSRLHSFREFDYKASGGAA